MNRVTRKYDNKAGCQYDKGFVRAEKGGGKIILSSELKDKVIGWEKIDFEYDEKEIHAKRNDRNGLYKVWVCGRQCAMGGIAVFHKLKIQSGVRIPASVEGETIRIYYTKGGRDHEETRPE